MITNRSIYDSQLEAKMNETSHQCAHCGTDLKGKVWIATNGYKYCNGSCRDFFETARCFPREAPPPKEERQIEFQLGNE